MNTFKPDEMMLQNYLQNKLSPKDEEQMELWLADHPAALEELELDLMMKGGLDDLQCSEVKTVDHHLDNTPNVISWFNLPNFAVGALVALVMSFFYVNHKDSNTSPISSVQEFTISQTRSANEPIEIARNAEQILLKIKLKEQWVEKDGEFEVVLSSNDKIISTLSLKPTWEAQLVLILNIDSLNEKEYSITILNRDEVGGFESMYHKFYID